ncbi:unnamed protein product, partial [Pylaiella littoralis]
VSVCVRCHPIFSGTLVYTYRLGQSTGSQGRKVNTGGVT